MVRRLVTAAWIWAVWSLVAGASLALAQVNTGTVLGTVKDAQGGVIPGATVTLISEARGTRTAPVVTSESGDFVFQRTAGNSELVHAVYLAWLRRTINYPSDKTR